MTVVLGNGFSLTVRWNMGLICDRALGTGLGGKGAALGADLTFFCLVGLECAFLFGAFVFLVLFDFQKRRNPNRFFFLYPTTSISPFVS